MNPSSVDNESLKHTNPQFSLRKTEVRSRSDWDAGASKLQFSLRKTQIRSWSPGISSPPGAHQIVAGNSISSISLKTSLWPTLLPGASKFSFPYGKRTLGGHNPSFLQGKLILGFKIDSVGHLSGHQIVATNSISGI